MARRTTRMRYAITLSRRFPLLLFLPALIAAGSGCGGQVVEPDWGYAGENRPENWASLSDDYATCGEGMQQSPVDITGYAAQEGPPLDFDYAGDAVSAANTHRQAYFTFGGDDILRVGRTSYHLKSAHLHAPSEHLIDGESFAAELHMVHADGDGNLAVIGVLFRVGAANEAVQIMLDEAPETGRDIDDGLTLNAESLEPESQSYYHYAGSKTTPPCDEPVAWYVLQTPLSISQGQADQITELSDGPNNRPVQLLGGREIRLIGT